MECTCPCAVGASVLIYCCVSARSVYPVGMVGVAEYRDLSIVDVICTDAADVGWARVGFDVPSPQDQDPRSHSSLGAPR